METDDPVPKWCKHMQDLPKDSVRRLRKQEKADAVQNTGRLQLPEQENKRSLPDMSPERNEARETETQDAQRRALSRMSLHDMWSIPGIVTLSADEKRACRRMPNMRTGTMRSMRCYVTPRKLYGYGYLPLLPLRRHQAYYMPGLQGTTACETRTATGPHGKQR